MTKEDRDRAQARADKATRAAHDARSGKADRDAGSKAVLDNMAKLKAMRLAREAAEPRALPPPKSRARQGEEADEKAPAPVRLAGEPAERWTANLIEHRRHWPRAKLGR